MNLFVSTSGLIVLSHAVRQREVNENTVPRLLLFVLLGNSNWNAYIKTSVKLFFGVCHLARVGGSEIQIMGDDCSDNAFFAA